MLLLFLVNYLPAMIVAAFINICTDCQCDVVHLLRDVVFLFIETSGLLRALLFIARLEVLRNAMKEIVCHVWGRMKNRQMFRARFRNTKEHEAEISIEEEGNR